MEGLFRSNTMFWVEVLVVFGTTLAGFLFFIFNFTVEALLVLCIILWLTIIQLRLIELHEKSQKVK